jgi:hypothetical protein
MSIDLRKKLSYEDSGRKLERCKLRLKKKLESLKDAPLLL